MHNHVVWQNSIIFYCTAQFQIQLPKLSNLFQSKITDTNERFDM